MGSACFLYCALKLAPDSAQAMISMGNDYAKQNQPGDAQEGFVKAVAVDPHDRVVPVGLGIQSVRLGQIDEGLTHVREAVILKPDFGEGYEIPAAAYGEPMRRTLQPVSAGIVTAIGRNRVGYEYPGNIGILS